MKPFGLTSVLKYREQLEDAAVIRLSEAMHTLDEKKESLQQVEEEYLSLVANYKKYQKAGMSIAELVRYENRLVWLTKEKEKCFHELSLASEKVENRRKIVMSKRRDKKVLEQLKNRQDSAWRSFLDKKENAQLDEISVLSYQRKTSND